MDLIIDGYIIDTPIIEILTQCKKELTNGKLSSIIDNGTWVSITCPFHSDGHERRNSCGVVSDPNSKLEYGIFNCFTCKEKGKLYHLIGGCFDESDEFGKRWLISRFGRKVYGVNLDLQKIELPTNKKVNYLDESILDTFQSYHPYMTQRKLTSDVISKFKIKYDPKSQCIIFPVWDENGNLLFLTSRNVNYKYYHLPKDIDKPIYLLNFINKWGIKYAIICESQINALYCHSLGLSAISTFGCNVTKKQIEILKKSGIRHFIIGFDGDDAGRKGAISLKKSLQSCCMIDILELPQNKDLNDLSKDDIVELINKSGNSYDLLRLQYYNGLREGE